MLNVIATNDNITIFFNKESFVINKIKNEATFEKVLKKVEAGNVKWIEKNVSSIKNEIESKTDGVFTTSKGSVVLKGTTIPVPDIIIKKLSELEKEKEPILPLLRFWRKLSSNPSENSRNNLFEFMTKNNIPITEEGDIVTEKGVEQRENSYPGDLVDNYTNTLDNSIGAYVEMPREEVNADSNQTCSFGLHVAAPDYVRKIYSSSILVECIVNPRDVVSVPKDYDATKMRVCAYRVAGYSRKESRDSLKVVKLTDFFSTPIPEEQAKISNKTTKKTTKKTAKKVVLTKEVNEHNIDKMSASQIVAYVKEKTGEEITFSLKSKKSILNKAHQLLEVYGIKNSENNVQ